MTSDFAKVLPVLILVTLMGAEAGSRGEKLGIARLDLNDRIAEAVEKADLDPDQIALLGKLLGYLIR